MPSTWSSAATRSGKRIAGSRLSPEPRGARRRAIRAGVQGEGTNQCLPSYSGEYRKMCSSVDEPVYAYIISKPKRREYAREGQGAGAPAGRSGDQWGQAGSGGGTVRAGVGRTGPAGVHELPSRLPRLAGGDCRHGSRGRQDCREIAVFGHIAGGGYWGEDKRAAARGARGVLFALAARPPLLGP